MFPLFVEIRWLAACKPTTSQKRELRRSGLPNEVPPSFPMDHRAERSLAEGEGLEPPSPVRDSGFQDR